MFLKSIDVNMVFMHIINTHLNTIRQIDGLKNTICTLGISARNIYFFHTKCRCTKCKICILHHITYRKHVMHMCYWIITMNVLGTRNIICFFVLRMHMCFTFLNYIYDYELFSSQRILKKANNVTINPYFLSTISLTMLCYINLLSPIIQLQLTFFIIKKIKHVFLTNYI